MPSVPFGPSDFPAPEREAEDRLNAAFVSFAYLMRLRTGASDTWLLAAFRKAFPGMDIAADPAVRAYAERHFSTLLSAPPSGQLEGRKIP